MIHYLGIMLLGIVLLPLAFWLICWLFLTGTVKYPGPSSTLRGAKWSGAFICDVKLERLDSPGKLEFFQPKEIWLETAYEYNESTGWRKRVAGEYLCLRYDKSSGITIGGNFPTTLDGADITGGASWSGGNATFYYVAPPARHIPELGARFPSEGELVFREAKEVRESRYRYTLKR